MRAAVERFAWRMWRDEAGWPGRITRILLLPLEGVWRLATSVRNRRWDRSGGTRIPGLTVVSVGNLAAGGTGKTPMSAWVAGTLAEADARPAVLLRGYGEDEIRLHRRWNPRIPVVAGADRVEGARRAREEGARTAVLDDGFQHRRLHRTVDLVLLAAADPVPGPVLPRGPYREPPRALRRADVVVITRRSEDRATARAVVERLERAGVLSGTATTAGLRLAPAGTVALEDFAAEDGAASGGVAGGVAAAGGDADGGGTADSGGGSVGSGTTAEASRGERRAGVDENGEGSPGALAVTAIARPEAFRRDVEALTGTVTELDAYPDHHVFDADDARRIRSRAAGRAVFVTEKDAVKLVAHRELLPPVRVVLQRLEWDWGEEEVRRRLRSVVPRAEEAS